MAEAYNCLVLVTPTLMTMMMPFAYSFVFLCPGSVAARLKEDELVMGSDGENQELLVKICQNK